jgi:hypothetical protein
MKTDRERRPVMLRRTRRGLEPVMPADAEALDAIDIGADVEVTIKRRRSLPQLRLYWSMLAHVVLATGDYPSPEHLHDAVKMALGYTTPIRTIEGGMIYVPDSVAIAAMDQTAFKGFFDATAMLLAERYGFDPLAEMGVAA